MERIKKLCSYLSRCSVFADIGCDHGYCTEYMLKNSLCDSAIISDISPKSLKKAERLLGDYIEDCKCRSVCCFGLEKIEYADLVLIAGMGGEEIISILKSAYIPERFVLQPMHNVQKLRQYLLERGAEITADEPFEADGKFYFVLKGSRSGNKSEYTKAELVFGKGDIKGAAGRYIAKELEKKRSYLKGEPSAGERARILEYIELAEGVLKGET